MNNELISVIVPVYNTEKYLSGCLDSILSQSHRELEVIVIDDGSADSSHEICDDYARRDSRVRVFHRENSGISACRSFGLQHCRGELVAFTDSDDRMTPEMLEKLLRRMKEDNSQLCVCEFLKIREDGSLFPSQPRPLPEGLISGEEAIYLLGGDKGHQLVPMCNKLFRKEIFSGIVFPPRMFCEDEMLIHRILYNCSRVSLMKEGLYLYLQRGSSITANINDVYLMDAASAFLDRSLFLNEKGFSEPALRALKGAVGFLYISKTEKENRPRERELSRALRAAASSLTGSGMDARLRLKLFLLPEGKELYKALRRIKAALTGQAGKRK